jgi:hypothetical protein
MVKIFERVDSTVYSREMSELTRTIISTGSEIQEWMRDQAVWRDMQELAECNPVFADELKKFLTFYNLCKHERSKSKD